MIRLPAIPTIMEFNIIKYLNLEVQGSKSPIRNNIKLKWV
jgi:hypothetical protein